MILLDTHTWVWWVSRRTDLLPPPLFERIAGAEEDVAIASVSCLKVALLAKKGRLELSAEPEEWFDLAIEAAGIQLLPLTPAIAARSANLPDLHRDPIDRILIATALAHDAVLLTRDAAIQSYPRVRTEWA